VVGVLVLLGLLLVGAALAGLFVLIFRSAPADTTSGRFAVAAVVVGVLSALIAGAVLLGLIWWALSASGGMDD
jgi:hypothetical protein